MFGFCLVFVWFLFGFCLVFVWYLLGSSIEPECQFFDDQKIAPLFATQFTGVSRRIAQAERKTFLIFVCLMPRKDCNPKLRTRAGLKGQMGEASHGRDARLGSGRSDYRLRGRLRVSAETASDPEPRRRRPF